MIKIFGTAVSSILLFFLIMGNTNADSHSQITLEEVDKKAETMLTYIENNQAEEAKHIYNWISEHLPAVPFQQYHLNTDQVSALLSAGSQAEAAVTSASMEAPERINNVLAFRLSIDAAISKEHPIWKEAEKPLVELLEKAEQELDSGNVNSARQSFQQWQRQFEIIRSSIYIGVPEETYLPFLSHIRYMDQEDAWLETGGSNELTKLKTEMVKLFQEKKQSSADPALWTVILLIGCSLLLALGYAGWKKYKAEKARQRMRND
ncbi:sporulation protein YpjB [Alteribacillus sp. HJP-4]|uniref:sporulation protein YpjB n=1 Tax=Alteribacillus sp. HJP-4 TaxID=2775394 RepID=UPI0035CCD9EE